jgi:hypothetical protein
MPVMTAMAMESAWLPVLVKLAPVTAAKATANRPSADAAMTAGRHGQAGAADRGHHDVTGLRGIQRGTARRYSR